MATESEPRTADDEHEDADGRGSGTRRRRFVRTRVFDCEKDPGFFPELHDPAGLAVPWLKDRRRHFGVSFSGGGCRSSAATLGHLRGLAATGLLGELSYVSAVSGGGWTATPWVYLPADQDEALFLGAAKEPQELTAADFEEAPAGSMAAAISGAYLFSQLYREFRRGGADETGGRAVGNIFLDPFGLDDLGRFPGFHAEAVAATVAANRRRPDSPYHLEPGDFYTVRRGRPYLILSATLTRIGNPRLELRRMPCEMTPLYTGVRRLFAKAGEGGLPIGGGYVETFGFDTAAPIDEAAGRFLVEIGDRHFRFTLSDMLGASGGSLREVIDLFGVNFVGLPEFRYWPILRPGHIEHHEYGFGDGALLENLGLMPLLVRQVENIVVFVNSEHPFEIEEDGKASLASSLEPLFRPTKNADLLGQRTDELFDLNVVFRSHEFDELVESFRICQQAGQPLVHFGRYEVQENRHFRIRPYRANIVFVYSAAVPAWEAALPPETRQLLERGELKRFPHYRTTFENFPQPIHLEKIQINALAHLSCYAVLRLAARLRRFFGL